MGDANPIRTLGDYSKPSHEGYRIIPLNSPKGTMWYLFDPTPSGWCKTDAHSMDFVKAISLPQDVPSTSDRRLIKLEHQVQRLMEAYIAPMQPTQVNKITSSCEIYSGPHDTQYCMENPEQAFVDYASSRTDETGSRLSMNQGPRSFKEATNAWKGKPNFNWAHAQTFTSPQDNSFSTYSSNFQTKLEKALIDFDSHQEKRLSSLRTQLGQQQDDMFSKINLLWKTVSEKLYDTPIHKEEGNVKFSTTEYKDHEMTVESEEEFEEETEEEIKEEEEDILEHFDTFPTMKELRYHEWLLKNP
ncbi:hypothetical protein Tco_1368588 [Tanacetum coccineum]